MPGSSSPRIGATASGGDGMKSFCEWMEEIRECQWYWGPISAREAIRLLRERAVGTFLVRDSHSDKSIFALSYRTENGVYHSRLARYNGSFCLGSANSLIRSPSLKEFIKMTMVRSSATYVTTASSSNLNDLNNGDHIGVDEDGDGDRRRMSILMHPSSSDPSASPIELRYPLRRNEFLPSLKHICRLVIRKSIQQQDAQQVINSFPLPNKLKHYLKSPTYLNVCNECCAGDDR